MEKMFIMFYFIYLFIYLFAYYSFGNYVP